MSEEICKNCKYHYTEEISFDYPQSCCNKTNPNHTTEEWLHCDCFEYSKNYITNLQQKVEQLEKENKEIKRLNNIIKEALILTENARFKEQYASDEILLPILNKLRESGIRNYIKVEGSDKE